MARASTIVLACLLSGCAAAASPPAHHPGPPPAVREHRPSPAADAPRDVLTLRDVSALVLLRNPELAEHSWEVRASEAALLQAGARPNPEASVYVEDVLGTGRFRGGREAQMTLQLGQALELGGRRAARIAAAAGTRDVASRAYEAKRVEVLAAAARRFIDLLAAQELVELARTNVALMEATLEDTARRVRAGAGSPLDERKARVELARGRIVAEHAEHEMAVAHEELAATWGGGPPAFERVAGDLFERAAVPDHEHLAARLAQAPEMLRHLSERQLRDAEIRLADARRIPTPVVAAGVRRLEGRDDEAFVFGVSVPLPIADRQRGAREEARALRSRTEEAGRTLETRLRTLLFTLHQELRHAAIALDALEREVVPQAEDALAFSRRGFAEGRFSYLDVLDAERTLASVRRERIETAATYHRLVLEMERITGEPLQPESLMTKTEAP